MQAAVERPLAIGSSSAGERRPEVGHRTDAIRGPHYRRLVDSVPMFTESCKPCPWRNEMLETIAIVLVVMWVLGLVTSYTMGGFIHILLVLAVIVVLFRVLQGRRI
jgi:Family of unknown function (DUF5670)